MIRKLKWDDIQPKFKKYEQSLVNVNQMKRIKVDWIKQKRRGKWCGPVGRAVASDTRDPWFECRHRQNVYHTFVNVNCVEKTKIKKGEAGNSPFFEKWKGRNIKIGIGGVAVTCVANSVDNRNIGFVKHKLLAGPIEIEQCKYVHTAISKCGQRTTFVGASFVRKLNTISEKEIT